MSAVPAFGFEQLFTHVIGEMARAMADRPEDTPDQRAHYMNAAIHTIMSFLPRDVMEAILAGHCVMFHDVLVRAFQEIARTGLVAPKGKGSVFDLNKAFLANLSPFLKLRARPSEGRRDTPESTKQELTKPEAVAPARPSPRPEPAPVAAVPAFPTALPSPTGAPRAAVSAVEAGPAQPPQPPRVIEIPLPPSTLLTRPPGRPSARAASRISHDAASAASRAEGTGIAWRAGPSELAANG